MDKQLAFTKQQIKSIAKQGAEEALSSLDNQAIDIAGCSIVCILRYEDNVRNGIQNLISLKAYCMQNNLPHRIVFEILRLNGWIEYQDEETKISNILTDEGFVAINGIKDQSSPVMTTINATLYVNDKHPLFEDFIDTVKSHELLSENNEYNKKVRNKKNKYSKHELEIAKRLNIKITSQKEIIDGK